MVDTASSSRAGTPVRAFGIPTMTKKKKKKMTEAGIVYASDGSLAGVGAGKFFFIICIILDIYFC